MYNVTFFFNVTPLYNVFLSILPLDYIVSLFLTCLQNIKMIRDHNLKKKKKGLISSFLNLKYIQNISLGIK